MPAFPPIGLWTSPNEHGEVPKGALSRAENVVLSRDKVLEPKRGRSVAIAPGVLPAGAEAIIPFQRRLLLHLGSTLRYTDEAVTAAISYPVSILSPAAGRRLRAAKSNKNLYLATSEGLKRLDSVAGSIVDAGVPMGLDVQGALSGGSGFLPNDTAVGYRVVWGTRDANGNLILGAPSGRAVVPNSAGGTRDVAVSTSIPSGLTSSHFWQLYRTAPSATAATDPGDEMGLVFEGPRPSDAAITSLTRLTNVVTAATAAAHGFVAGQLVRVSPGGSPATSMVAVGVSSAIQRSTDHGATWSSAGISGLPAGDYYAIASKGDLYVAIGASVCATSPDGLTWTSRTVPAGTYRAVKWIGNRFVAVGMSGVGSYSADGITWTACAPGATYNWFGLAWNGSTLVAVGESTLSAQAYSATSGDGITWSSAHLKITGLAYATGVAWNGTRWAAVGANAGATAAAAWTTNPGGSWTTAATMPAPAIATPNGVVWTGTAFVAVGTTNSMDSADGNTWTSRAMPNGSTAWAVTWDATNVVSVGADCATAPGAGTPWTDRTPVAGTFRAVAPGGGASFAAGEYLVASTPTGTSFTYAENGIDGTLTAGQTATPLTATTIDQIPSVFSGATLYTSQSQEGILASAYEPPLALDVAEFRGSLFWLGTTDRATLDFWLLASGSPSGVQSGDTVTINGMVFTGGASEVVSTRTFLVTTSGTPTENVRNTAASLIRIVNRAQGSPVYLRDLSGATDQPGHLQITTRSRTDSITLSVSRSSAFHLADGTSAAPETHLNRLAWSTSGKPDAATLTGYQDIGADDGIALRALRDSLFIIKKDGIWRATGDRFTAAAGPTISPLDTTTEIIAPESAVVLDNTIFALSTKGIVQISDTGVTIISRPIEDQIRALLVEPLRSTVAAYAFGIAYEQGGRYELRVPLATTDTLATWGFVYDHFASMSIGSPVWTETTHDTLSGVVNPVDGKLYEGDATSIYRERKEFDFTDYSDSEEALNITLWEAPEPTKVQMDNNNAAVGDMLVKGSARGLVVARNGATLTLDRTWTGGTGAATLYHPIPCVFEFAPIIPAPGAHAQFGEVSFLWRWLAGASFVAEFATELVTTYSAVTFQGSVLYGLSEAALSAFNLRTRVPSGREKAARLNVRFTHAQAWCPFALEAIDVEAQSIRMRMRK